MLICFSNDSGSAIPLIPILTTEFNDWLQQQSAPSQTWIKTVNFTAKAETFCVVPNAQGGVEKVLVGLKDKTDFWSFGALSTNLPQGQYCVMQQENTPALSQIALAWALGAYQFTRYKASNKTIAQLVIPAAINLPAIENKITAIYLVRDLINTPTEDMGPEQLAAATQALALKFNAEFTQIVGADLLQRNYPAIHAVGRASQQEPRLLDMRWGKEDAPKITLVGKGVCFDSGGLNIKTGSGMTLMKKDMGGAAQVLGLAQMIMAAQLPVRLRVLIPAVENSIAGNAFRPGDVITTRSGLTVEITNTDAEGRLVLGDALVEACTEKPELLIDIATLTGAARVAVGTEIGAFFTDEDIIAEQLMQSACEEQDPIWRLPLFAPYRKLLDSAIADITNASNSSYAGASTAALYLKEFVHSEIPWLHFDVMAWNLGNRPGRPEGGEAMVIRALFNYLCARFK